jgi:hypothetical protein
MSLPARQQRVLDHLDEIFQAGEPHLAGMYAIFARLCAGEPVAAESLGRGRLAWRGTGGTRGTAVCAAVLVPVMFAMIALGVLLGGSARGATTCGVSSHFTMRGAPWASRGSCPAGHTRQAKEPVNGVPATVGRQAHGSAVTPVTRSGGASCMARMRGARPVISSDPSPAARSPAPALRSGTC